MLNVRDLNVAYGAVRVLWNVSFDVKGREITTIVGANNAGKTTTLKTIAGLLKPNKGEIEFDGMKIHGKPAHQIVELGISYVPEGRRLFPSLTVAENLELGAYTKKARDKLSDTMEWVFQLFPRLKERAHQLAGTLSGGEQQMLAIGRALMSRPKLLMLDEPSLGLAPIVVKTLFETIENLHREGVTILLVEQNVYHSLKISHRAYVMERGKIVLSGKGEELLSDERIKKSYLGM